MKNQEIKDERVISQKREIKSNAYSILIYLLLISILFQQYILNVPAAQFAGEFLCLMVTSIYVTLKNISLGLDISSTKSRNPKALFLNSMFLSAITAVIYTFISGVDIEDSAIFFIFMTIIYFVSNFLLHHFVKKKQNQIDKELDQEE